MNPFGTIAPPPGVNRFDQGNLTGLPKFLNVIILTLIMIASLYAFLNFIFAGYSFMSAGGDPKKVEDAWKKIWQTILGLVVAAGAFVLAGIIGRLIFGDYSALLQVRLFGP